MYLFYLLSKVRDGANKPAGSGGSNQTLNLFVGYFPNDADETVIKQALGVEAQCILNMSLQTTKQMSKVN